MADSKAFRPRGSTDTSAGALVCSALSVSWKRYVAHNAAGTMRSSSCSKSRRGERRAWPGADRGPASRGDGTVLSLSQFQRVMRRPPEKGGPPAGGSSAQMVCGTMETSSPGAQTERRGDAGPVRGLLGGRPVPAVFVLLKRARVCHFGG